MYELKAKLTKGYPVESRKHNEKTYTTQVVEVETLDAQYPTKLSLKLVNKAVGKLTKNDVGKEFTFKFNLKGFEWTDKQSGESKVINSIEVWFVGKPEGQVTPQAEAIRPPQQQNATPPPSYTPTTNQDDSDGLPF